MRDLQRKEVQFGLEVGDRISHFARRWLAFEMFYLHFSELKMVLIDLLTEQFFIR